MMTDSAPEGIGGFCLDEPASPVLQEEAPHYPQPAAAVPDVAIVIPAYNEAATIADIVRRALAVAPAVIVVDDGSSDGTGSIAQRCGATVLRNPVNSGKGASLWRGMMHALNAGIADVVTLDADGQHRPEDVARLVEVARRNPGRIVIGSRRAHKDAFPRARYVANRVADFWISWASGYPIDDTQSGFRVYPAAALRALSARPPLATGFAFESELLIGAGWQGVRTVSVDIPALYGSVLRRPSYFRPVADICRIVVMVASKLLRRGMYPAGLWRTVAAGIRPR
jgi:glycosyltransferase involved in cell wall biosynthesis